MADPAKEPRQKVLIVDGNAEEASAMGEALRQAGLRVETCTEGGDGLQRALKGDTNAVVTEQRLQGMGGLELISRLHEAKPRLPVIMASEHAGSRNAIEAIKRGAFDCLLKPVDLDELISLVREALAAARRSPEPVGTKSASDDQDTLLGRSLAMRRIYRELGRISATPVTVLIRGETGTGKELIARAIYQHGHRAHKPLITVNCAAIPENLLESELFGHEKGAFTGADSARPGKFELAHNATLFLDEIGDLDYALQAKLLRVLQEKLIQRVGGNADIPVDVRIIAATHRDLEDMTAAGRFRPDLFYRLNVVGIDLPPLRERREDIPILINHFMSRFADELGIASPAMTRQAAAFLVEQPWPGNVRQLQNVLRKALLKCRDYPIDRTDVEELIAETGRSTGSQTTLQELATLHIQRAADGEIPAAYPAMLAAMERELLGAAIDLAKGNQTQASRWLGISRLTLREKLRQYGLHPRP